MVKKIHYVVYIILVFKNRHKDLIIFYVVLLHLLRVFVQKITLYCVIAVGDNTVYDGFKFVAIKKKLV